MKNKVIILTVAVVSVIGFLSTVNAAARSDAALETARASLKAHGGEKFARATSIVIRGSVEVTAPNATQVLPAAFTLVYAGEKYRFDLKSIVINFTQVSDGEMTNTTMPGISLPPITRVGLAVLPRIEENGYIVSILPEKLRKKKGFRITSPEGYFTDFIVDEKTSLVKSYQSSYEVNGREVSTAVEINKYRDVEGVMVNERFSQRLDFGQFTSYAEFKAKEITVNTTVEDTVFKIK